jgi:ADP-ribose diphosphatase
MDYTPRKPKGTPITTDPYFTLMADADGVGFIHCGDSALVVPMLEDGRVLLAVERSPAMDREVLVLSGGAIEEGETPEEAANRELQEELGWRAERLDFLGELHPYKYLTSRYLVFLARDLVSSRLPGDEPYVVGTRPVALDRFHELCATGELHDAAVIAALCLTRELLRQEMDSCA